MVFIYSLLPVQPDIDEFRRLLRSELQTIRQRIGPSNPCMTFYLEINVCDDLEKKVLNKYLKTEIDRKLFRKKL